MKLNVGRFGTAKRKGFFTWLNYGTPLLQEVAMVTNLDGIE